MTDISQAGIRMIMSSPVSAIEHCYIDNYSFSA